MAARRNGAGGKACPAALNGHGRVRAVKLLQDLTDLVLVLGKRDRLGRARAARFVAQVLLEFRAERFDFYHRGPSCLRCPGMRAGEAQRVGIFLHSILDSFCYHRVS